MNLFVLGATGRVGSRIVAHALQDGHRVRALVRNPDKLAVTTDKLAVIQGNALHKGDIERGIAGCDAVICALSTDGTTTLSEAMPLLVEAMHREGIRRIVTIGTAGILQSRENPALLRYQAGESKRKLVSATEEHRRVYELLASTDLEWTIVCPTRLSSETHTGTYRVERDYLPEGGSVISFADTAEFAYKQIADSAYLHSRVGIAY